MTHRITIALISVAALIALTQPARADLQICSRMSYVVEAAIAIEDKGAAATRGWFRIDPGQCRTVIQGTPPGETLYIHARALPVYGGSPLPQAGHADFCVGADNFVLAGDAKLQPRRPADRAFHRGQAERDREGAGRLSRRGRRIRPTSRRATPASSGCWRSPATTPTRSTASAAPRPTRRWRSSSPTTSSRTPPPAAPTSSTC